MNILATQYTLANKSFEIYVAGCKALPHCKGCHNELSWDFELGYEYESYLSGKIIPKIREFNNLIDNIMIFGGEPLDQPIDKLIDMVKKIKEFNKTLWLFTRYSLEEVKDKLKSNIALFDYIKCGRYEQDLITDSNIQYGIKLATSNQKIYKKGLDY